jgi:hypoxanthine phosphoribosyltransferase
MYQIFLAGKAEVYAIAVCKVIYYFERRHRIEKGTRNEFPAWHSFEHIGLYLLLKEMTKTEFSLITYLGILVFFIIFQAVFIISVNYYIYYMHASRMPKWVKENKQLQTILADKIESNSNSYKLHNYAFKPWFGHLKFHYITWQHIEKVVDEMILRHQFTDIDTVVGISTGGAFVGQYLAMRINKPHEIINSKLWSGMSFPQNIVRISKWMLGREVTPRITGNLDVKGKRVLLVDDTSYTGITLKGASKYLKTNEAASVKTLVLWINSTQRAPIDYYYETNQRVPIIWEWGVEID